MRITLKKKSSDRVKSRLKSKARIRKKVIGSPEKPRLAIFRSGKHTYAQIIDDQSQTTLVSASTVEKSFSSDKCKSGRDAGEAIGRLVAERAKEKNIERVVFDRGGYVFHGRVKSLADGAREAGLKF